MKVQFGKIIRESTVCVLCQQRDATTREHIPPQSLFIRNPREYLVVPCCSHCNSSTKLDDEYLCQTMSGASLVGQGRNVWKKKVALKFKDFPKTQAGLRKSLSLQRLDVEEFGKIIFPVMTIDSERIRRSIRKMVYGLYWFHSGGLLNSTAQLHVNYLDALQTPKFLKMPEVDAIAKQASLGVYKDPTVMQTFFYTGAFVAEQKASIWFFFIYKQNLILAVTR